MSEMSKWDLLKRLFALESRQKQRVAACQHIHRDICMVNNLSF